MLAYLSTLLSFLIGDRIRKSVAALLRRPFNFLTGTQTHPIVLMLWSSARAFFMNERTRAIVVTLLVVCIVLLFTMHPQAVVVACSVTGVCPCPGC